MKASKRWFLALSALLTVFALLMTRLYWPETGLRDRLAKKHQAVAALRADVERIYQANQALAAELDRMQANPDAQIEYQARRNLGMIRRGETFYIVKDRPFAASDREDAGDADPDDADPDDADP